LLATALREVAEYVGREGDSFSSGEDFFYSTLKAFRWCFAKGRNVPF